MDNKTRIGLIFSVLALVILTMVIFGRRDSSKIDQNGLPKDDTAMTETENAADSDTAQISNEQGESSSTETTTTANTQAPQNETEETVAKTDGSPEATTQTQPAENIGPTLTPQQQKARQIVEGYRKRVGGSTPFVKPGQMRENPLSNDHLPPSLAKPGVDTTKISAADLKKLQQAREELAKPEKEEKVSACYTTNFKHKTFRSIMEIEGSTEYKNLLVVEAPNNKPIAESSVCIRVNGVPVKHQKIKSKPNYFVIGPLADAKSKVSATFCTGASRCSEGCKIPKDDFMEAIGGISDELGDQTKYVAWDIADTNKKPSKEQSLLDVELKALRSELVGSQTQKTKIYSGWTRTKNVESCGTNNRTTRVSKLN